MNTKYLMGAELYKAIEAEKAERIDIKTITPEVQKQLIEVARQNLQDTEKMGIKREEVFIPNTKPDNPPVRCLKYSTIASETTGAILQIHGGGWIFGNPEFAEPISISLARELGAAILSVDYRLAPQHSYPAPVDDCYSALAWLHNSAEKLNIDPNKIAIYGESAGGTLAAAVTQMARDKKEYPICFQALTYPALDDSTGSEQNPGDPLTGQFVWDRENNQYGWSKYLGDAERIAPQVPAKAKSLKDLPPAWISTAMFDLFRDENIDYAQRLMKAGVATELIVYPNVCHGFDLIAPTLPVSQRYKRDLVEALKRGLS